MRKSILFVISIVLSAQSVEGKDGHTCMRR